MKITPSTEKYITLGAKIHESAGHSIPIEYPGIIDGHITVCQGVGVPDVPHMGKFRVRGPQALAFLQKITSNNVAALVPGKIQYTCFPNEDGGIVDDLLAYQYESEKYMLMVNISNMEEDWNWCTSHNTEGAELGNSPDNIVQLTVQGSKTVPVLQELMDADLATIPYYTSRIRTFAGEESVIISNTGYTGAGGSELYFYPSVADSIWKAISEAGEEYGIKFIGLGARGTLRLEMGFYLCGNDSDDTTSLIEIGLGWVTKSTEDRDFVNRPMLEKQKAEGVTRRLIGSEMVDHGAPRHGHELVNDKGEKVGMVASGTMSPTHKVGIGTGYVKPEYSKMGTKICIDMRGWKLKAVVVKPPFRK